MYCQRDTVGKDDSTVDILLLRRHHHFGMRDGRQCISPVVLYDMHTTNYMPFMREKGL